jgi:Transglycosylase-like domain
MMRRKTTTALAIAGTALAAPAALAADPPTPTALRAPLAGHPTVHSQMRAERREDVQDDLTARAARLAERRADARGEGLSTAAERRRLSDHTVEGLRARIGALRSDIRAAREAAAAPAATASPALEAIAACESGGDPTAIGGGGLYRGKYQFSMSTWASVGGQGDPAAAPEAEQDARAAALYAREGAAPWPVCGG